MSQEKKSVKFNKKAHAAHGNGASVTSGVRIRKEGRSSLDALSRVRNTTEPLVLTYREANGFNKIARTTEAAKRAVEKIVHKEMQRLVTRVMHVAYNERAVIELKGSPGVADKSRRKIGLRAVRLAIGKTVIAPKRLKNE